MPGFIGRTAFVGREPELRRLQAAFDEAASGHWSLVMVAGEPGIGKTALCRQLLAYATQRGGCALAGHCYEQGSLSLPYLPFVEALGAYVRGRDPAEILRVLGPAAVELTRILPELRDRLPKRISSDSIGAPSTPLRVSVSNPPASPVNPQEARWRLFQAVTQLVHVAGAGQPLCLLLEDLHDADRDSLDLLLHLARQMEGERLLVVGTYRDVEVDRAPAVQRPGRAAPCALVRPAAPAGLGARPYSADAGGHRRGGGHAGAG